MIASELKVGMLIMLNGVAKEVTHVRKSRRYRGFMQVQYVTPNENPQDIGVRVDQINLRTIDSLECVPPEAA